MIVRLSEVRNELKLAVKHFTRAVDMAKGNIVVSIVTPPKKQRKRQKQEENNGQSTNQV